MSVYKTRIIQASILLVYSLLSEHKFALAVSLIIALLPLRYQLIATLLAVSSLCYRIWETLWLNICIIVVLLGLHVYMHGFPWTEKGRKIRV